MRPGIDADTLALYQSGHFKLHTRFRVANGSGTLIDLQGRYIGGTWNKSDPNAPISRLSIELLREIKQDGTDSLSPLVQASSFNRLDDGVTYSPLLRVGHLVTLDIALTDFATARPADNSILWYEIFRGNVSKVSWPKRQSPATAVIQCKDQAGFLKTAKTETAYSYASGTALETVLRQILDDNGFASIPLDVPVPTGKVIEKTYEPGLQKSVWDLLWGTAQANAYLLWFRYRADNTPALTLFQPPRDKVDADMMINQLYDFNDIDIDEEAIRNVGRTSWIDVNGIRQITDPLVNQTSVDKYGGPLHVRRPFWIAFDEDSTVRTLAAANDVNAAALSDVSDPDATATAFLPPMVFGECSEDLYLFPADKKFFDTDQKFAPFSITVSFRAEADATSLMPVRGKPSAGWKSWLARQVSSVALQNSIYTLNTTVTQAVTDSILTESEKAAIKQDRDRLNAEHENFSQQYTTLAANPSLTDPAGSNLDAAWTAYNSAWTDLNTAIDNITADSDITQAERDAYTAASNTYVSDIGTLAQRIQEAIDSISSIKSGTPVCTIKETVAIAEPQHTVTFEVFPASAAFSATLNGAVLSAVSTPPLVDNGGGSYSVVLTRDPNNNQNLVAQATADGYAPASQFYTIDRSPTPGFSNISSPTPLFSGTQQSGWLISGAADDSTKQIDIAVTGNLSIRETTPALSGGSADVSTVKSFSISLNQNPGAKGTVTVTPRDGTKYGQAWTKDLILAPNTTITITAKSTTVRRVTLQADPATAQVYATAKTASGALVKTYTSILVNDVNAPSSRNAVGTLTFFLNLKEVAEDVIIEYYAVANSAVEELKKQRIDEDSDPEVTLTATGGNNTLDITVTPDDDLTKWKLWGRLGSSPIVDGVPDNKYLIVNDGAQHDRKITRWAKEGLWYLVAYAYNSAGKWTPFSLTVAVTATPSTAPALATLTAARQDNTTGTDYHILDWTHNAPITSTSGHKVVILENNSNVGQVDAYLDTAQVATPEQKTSGEANAVFRRYEYTLQLVDTNGNVIDSYPLAVEGYYDDGTVTQAVPAETPGIPVLSQLGHVIYADWTNSSSTWEIELDWWKGGVSVDVRTLAPSSDTASRYYSPGDSAQARVRYKNAAGPGAWSLPSNPLTA